MRTQETCQANKQADPKKLNRALKFQVAMTNSTRNLSSCSSGFLF